MMVSIKFPKIFLSENFPLYGIYIVRILAAATTYVDLYVIFCVDITNCVWLALMLEVLLLCFQDEIEQVILFGGGTRVPKIQEILLKTIKRCVHSNGYTFNR